MDVIEAGHPFVGIEADVTGGGWGWRQQWRLIKKQRAATKLVKEITWCREYCVMMEMDGDRQHVVWHPGDVGRLLSLVAGDTGQGC